MQNNKEQTKYKWKHHRIQRTTISMQKCNKKIGIKNNPLIKNNKHYLQEIIDKIPGIIKIRYQSLCKISKYFQIFHGRQIFHQTIQNWSNQNHKEINMNKEFEYSSYYLYNEQFKTQ